MAAHTQKNSQKNSQALIILASLILGILAGYFMGPTAAHLKPIGDIFIKMIKMVLFPLIFTSIILVFCSGEGMQKIGRIGLKCFIWYFIVTIISILIALGCLEFFTSYFTLGKIDLAQYSGGDTSYAIAASKTDFSLIQAIVNIFPSNPVESVVKGDITQVLVFSLFFGVAMGLSKNKVQPAITFFEGLFIIIQKMTEVVIKFSPVGVFCLMAWLVGTQDISLLKSVGILIVATYVAGFIIIYILFTIVLLAFKINPLIFFRKIIPLQIFAFATSSSMASVPIAETVAERMGVSKKTYSFTIPFGVSINHNGTSLYVAMATVFIAKLFGMELTMANYFTISVMAMVLGLGAGGIPGTSIIMTSVVLVAIGLKADYVAIVVGVDRILDMLRTTINICSDVIITVVMGKAEGDFDKEVFNAKN